MKGKARYIRFGAMVVTFSLIGYALYYMASEFMNALEHDPDSSALICDTFAIRTDLDVCDSFQIHPAGMMTLCVGYDALVSSNVRVCDAIADNGLVHLQQRRLNIIHAREGVLIQGNPEETFYLKMCELKEPSTSRNDLIGVLADTVLKYSDSISYYPLSMKDNVVNFYYPRGMRPDSSFTAKAHRAYLKIKE